MAISPPSLHCSIACGIVQVKAPATLNTVLTVLSMLLKKAMEWQIIHHLPCTVKLLKLTDGSAKFYDFDGDETLVLAASVSSASAKATADSLREKTERRLVTHIFASERARRLASAG